MLPSKLIYIDSFSVTAFHETFNASSLEMMNKIFPRIEHYSSKSSYLNTLEILGYTPSNIRHKNIYIPNPTNKITRFLQLLFSFLWNIYFILFKSGKNTILYYNYNSLWFVPLINAICKYTNHPVIIMCHGELEFLLTNTKLNFISNKCLHWFKNKNIRIANNLYFCVASQSIIRNLHLAIAKQIESKFISFEHTFISHQIITTNKRNTFPLKIGIVGTINKFKGLENIIKLSSQIIDHNKIKLYALGRVFCNSKILQDSNIEFIPESEHKFIPKKLLNKYIDQMDILLFLYPENQYKLTASGAIFDCIDREKYILSLHNNYFDFLFSKYKIGLQMNNISEIANYINTIKEVPKIDFTEIKQKLSPEFEATSFEHVLKNIFKNYI